MSAQDTTESDGMTKTDIVEKWVVGEANDAVGDKANVEDIRTRDADGTRRLVVVVDSSCVTPRITEPLTNINVLGSLSIHTVGKEIHLEYPFGE